MDSIIGWAIAALIIVASLFGYIEYRTLKKKLDAVMQKLIDIKYR
jgi:hypothetical protein